ncbi:MAG: hypothetical protein R3B96_23885 [Pirellulaceae bacterium]
MSTSENIDVLMRVADAIAFAHARGAFTATRKPENVMPGGFGEVLVMDWGLALPVNRRKRGRDRDQANDGRNASLHGSGDGDRPVR